MAIKQFLNRDNVYVIAVANLASKSVPTAPFPSSWPTTPFFALLSNDAKLQVAQNNMKEITGKSFGNNGDIDIGIGDLYYTAQATIASINLDNADANSLAFSGVITGNVAAGIKIGCTNFGLNYDIQSLPNPAGTISLSISSGRSVVATTSNLNTFVLVLNPSGNPIEWLLSAATDAILQAITAIISPQISTLFNSISFSVWDLPNITFNYENISLTLVPTNVTIGDYNDMLSITGEVDITS